MVSVARTLAIALLVLFSLLAFPATLPWVLALWLAWATVRMLRGQRIFGVLSSVIVIVLIKRLPILPGVVVVLAVLIIVAIANRSLIAYPSARGVRPALYAALWIAFLAMVFDWQRSIHSSLRTLPHNNRPIVLLGDSLTAGESPLPGIAEPLRTMIDLPVIDLSRPGITASDALELLPALSQQQPQIVVVELGGHDYLKGRTSDETRRSLEAIIRTAHKSGAQVVLMEIPRAIISDPYWGLERRLAREYDLELISDTPIRTLIFWSPFAPPGIWLKNHRLSDDGLHANERGNQYLAQNVARTIDRLRAHSQ